MKKILFGVGCALLVGGVTSAQTFTIPERIERLASRAKESTNITLDGPLLQLASQFLNGKDENQKAAKDLISKLKGIHVRNFGFEKEGEYSDSDLDPIRTQLKSPGWAQIVENRQDGEHTQIFVKQEKDKVAGLVIISAERKELSIVIIDGQIDPKQISSLGGNFGIPKDLPTTGSGSAKDSAQ